MKAICSTLVLLMIGDVSFARNMSEPVYVDPFDRGAGSTVLTRATREGMVYGNPALLTLGGAWVRWMGLQVTMKPSGEIETVQSNINNLQNEDEGNSESNLQSILSALDFGIGSEVSIGLLNQYVALASFADVSAYFLYNQFGNTGIPGARGILEGMGGAALALAYAPVRWWSIGVNHKQLYGIYKDVVVTPTNSTESLGELQNINGAGIGQSTDVGSILFFQGFNVDYSLGLTIANLVPVEFSDNTHPKLNQRKNIGLGLALHTETNVIDFSLELHDIEAKSETLLNRRLKFGMRVLLWQILGLSAGYNNGFPTFGLAMDAYIFKMGLSYSHRIVGIGDDSFARQELTFTTTMGF
ncbi:MAG: hypothetical protein HRU19_00165 [Pseudobacteriovorax sp.]|nr:hypothetical protein [Pseudobacteriovorax sp.]